MVKIHYIMRVTLAAVGTRHPLGFAYPVSIPLNALILQCDVIVLVALIIIPLISTVAAATPVLRLTIRPDSEVGKRKPFAASRTFLHGYPSLHQKRVMGLEPTTASLEG